ncbi:amidohydrolase family protein [Methylomonas methanica]|uniref:Amidohydrolase n=1 Tax=Methylomonas methanica (strain DSM 25384 / MC09) TaxID=857087 RepID=F9ZXC5_METMM|nr:amidohydrolase family protein [Methylomonas methanica]AEF99735.1 amidohydrolase [Methylomonas methanica MC09]
MKPYLCFRYYLAWMCYAAFLWSSHTAFADSYIIHAARVFDGYSLRTDAAVLIVDGKIAKIDTPEAFSDSEVARVELGDATLLPGFIELHAHLTFRQVPAKDVLRHGITTLRDVGGPLHAPYGGDGSLRVMTSGPIITAPHGYPIPGLGEHDIAIPVANESQARETVRRLVAGGAMVIKVALEPGGESGAPWSHAHVHADQHSHTDSLHQPASVAQNWPLLPLPIVKAIVDEAHSLGRKVSTHIAETHGAQIALDAGIDEWAHAPCAALPDGQLQRAVEQNVKVVTTLDTLSKCVGVFSNVERLAAMGGELLYGAEIAHPDIPWGIDAQELLYLQQAAGLLPLEVLQTATAKAGAYLNIPLLGTLLPGAPADLIAVSGDPLQSLKMLEYPGLVISGGKIVLNHFAAPD